MKTRIFLLVALIATGFFTACNNDVAVDSSKNGPEISFRLQGGMPEVTTRALATTIYNLEAFVVFGTDNVLAATNDLLFDGKTVARKFGGTNDFAYAPAVYYSEGATNAGFFAFAPVSADVNNTNLASLLTGASFDYMVPAPDHTGNVSQEDLLVALTAPITPSTTAVNIDFEHALARIFITAENETPDPIIIKSLKLLNLATTGTFNIPPTFAWGWVPDMSTASGSEYEYILPESGVAVPGTIPPATPAKYYVTSMEQGMLILPQFATNIAPFDAFDSDDFALEVIYDFANLKDQTKNIVIYDTVTPGLWEFEMGKQYRINITFTGTAIKFEVTVHDFGAEIDVTTM